jgi:hypothetical protein
MAEVPYPRRYQPPFPEQVRLRHGLHLLPLLGVEMGSLI